MSTKVSTDLINLSGNTGGLVWAKGTTAQQPGSATAGDMRVDTTANTTLVYNGTEWKTLKETAFVVPPIPTHFLVVAGGGAGAASGNGTGSGAGGAGGLRTSYGSTSGGNSAAESTIEISLNTAYGITVGNEGAGSTTAVNGNQGYSSTFSTITSIGGGGGFKQRSGSASTVNGGSGGGGEGFTNSAGGTGVDGFGTGTANQGKDGGTGSSSASAYGGGGGGGAITNGGNGSSTNGGSGGTGLECSITATATFFAGGGGGGSSTTTGGAGGSSIGGNGGSSVTGGAAGDNGVFNTGSGGGGGGAGGGGAGGAGSPGVVILRYPTADLPYFTTTGTLNTPSTTDTVADTAYPVANTAYYKLDSNANDSAPSGYIGQGGIFNGSSSVVTLPSALSDGTTTPAVCISFWFNVGAEVTSSTSNNEIMTFAGNGKIALGSTSGSISSETFSVTSNVSNQYTYSRTNIPAGWNHAVVQWNSGTTKWDIYINSVQHTTYTFGTNNQSAWALKFGQRSTFYYDGKLDQVRIYNTALSASNVALLYAETSATSSTLNYPVGAGGIALYEFSGNANDTGGTYNGTATNVLYAHNGTATDVTFVNGRFNEAANFNGTSSVISLGTSSPLNTFGGAQTISVWVKPFSADHEAIIGYRQELSPYQWNLIEKMSNNTIRFLLGNYSGAGQFVFNSVGTITLNQWNHIAVTVDSTSAKIYINNGTPETQTGTPTSYSNSEPTFIGGDGTYDTDYFTGQIDQVRIFSSALSAANVTNLYNEHFPTKFTDGSNTALKFTGGTGTITFLDTAPILVDYLVVAGGGAGGNGMGAGGGAGGLITNYGGSTLTLAPATNYPITVGTGGAGTTADIRVNGSNSVFNTLTAIGGGGGSSLAMQRNANIRDGNPGGSGGGSSAGDPGDGYGGAAQQSSSASGGFGNKGGNNIGNTQGTYPGGGGGGANGAGGDATSASQQIGGAGGVGLQVNIDGNNYHWAGGGGGNIYSGGTNGGPGGIGGGGGGSSLNSTGGTGGGSAINNGANGGSGASVAGGNAGTNTGSGGGGATWSSAAGGNGGSGIVILRYPNTKTITVGAGLTATTATVGTDSVTTFTAGTGTITFS